MNRLAIKKKQITKREAEQRTAKHKRDFKKCLRCWSRIAEEVKESIDLGVPQKLGMTLTAWLYDTFPEKSASHLYRLIQDYRALDGISKEQLEKMPEGNAHTLATQLPHGVRQRPDIIEKAVRQKPAEFKETVAEVRKNVGLEPKEKWETWAVRLPISVIELRNAATAKIARILQVEITDQLFKDDFRKWTANRVAVEEAICQLINGTDESRLTIEILGGGPLEELSTETISEPLNGSMRESISTPTVSSVTMDENISPE